MHWGRLGEGRGKEANLEDLIRGGISTEYQCCRIDANLFTECKETRARSVGSATRVEAPSTSMQKSSIGLSFELVQLVAKLT